MHKNPDNKDVISQLLALMSQLRDPSHGCPWDQQQTYHSIVAHTLEEAYEVADVIERGAVQQDLKDELADLLFQVIFYAQLAKEDHYFDFYDIVSHLNQKLIRRHPHLFAQAESDTGADISVAAVKHRWQAIKQQERAKALAGNDSQHQDLSILANTPLALPALTRAYKLQKKAALKQFDWSHLEGVMAKLQEELKELDQAIASADQKKISAEMGDVLFTCVNMARHLAVNPEQVLRQASHRFEQRFRMIEPGIDQLQGQQMSEQEYVQALDALWHKAKQTLAPS